MIECQKASIYQHLYVPLVPYPISCIRVIKSQKIFTKTIPPSWFNVCFWGVLTSEHRQQLQSLESFMYLLLVIHLYILSKAPEDIILNYSPSIVPQSLEKCCINSCLLNFWWMKDVWNISINTIFFKFKNFDIFGHIYIKWHFGHMVFSVIFPILQLI